MDLTSEADLTELEISRIYYVKSYLQVWWVSDLCDAEGIMIEPKFYYSEKCRKVDFNKIEIKANEHETTNGSDDEAYEENESDEEAIRHRPSKFSFSTCEEINQGIPDERAWTAWKKFLRQKVMKKDFTLRKALGRWTFQPSTRKWPFYYSKSKDCVYRCYRENWQDHTSYIFDSHPRIPNEFSEVLDEELSDVDDDTMLYEIPLDCEFQRNHFPYEGKKK